MQLLYEPCSNANEQTAEQWFLTLCLPQGFNGSTELLAPLCKSRICQRVMTVVCSTTNSVNCS